MKTLHTSEILACTVKEFPCTYLGFLLTVRNVSRLNCYLFEKIADNFLGWKASLMNRAGLLRARLARLWLVKKQLFLALAYFVRKRLAKRLLLAF